MITLQGIGSCLMFLFCFSSVNSGAAAATWTTNSNTGFWINKDTILTNSPPVYETMTADAYVQIPFHGTGIRLYAQKDPDCGYARIYVDERYMGELNTFSSGTNRNVLIFETNCLRNTDHIIRVSQKAAAYVKVEGYIAVSSDGTNAPAVPSAQTNGVPYVAGSATNPAFAGLTVLQTNTFPHALHFRKSEADALDMGTNRYSEWNGTYSSLMGIVGKMYNEEDAALSGTNHDFPQRTMFKDFKTDHTNQLVLLHFNGKYRDMNGDRSTTYYFPQHFLYYVGKAGYNALTNTDEQSVIDTDSPVSKYFKLNIGLFTNDNEDVVLVKTTDDGCLDWSTCEYTTLIDYNGGNGTGSQIKVKRGAYGSTRQNWESDRYYLLVPVSSGPWGSDTNLNNLWAYNFSVNCPKKSQQNCADRFVTEMKDILLTNKTFSVSGFDGVELDILHSDIQGIGTGGRGIDSDGDLIADFGYSGETNCFGCGLYELAQKLRKEIGPDKLLMGDCSSMQQQRCFGMFNGMENEGFPRTDDFQSDGWTTAINRLKFWKDNAYLPALSYVNWKFKDGSIWTNPPHAVARLNLATLAAYDIPVAFFGYQRVGDPAAIHDEIVCGTNQTIGWMGYSKTGVVFPNLTNDVLAGTGTSVSPDFVSRVLLSGTDMTAAKDPVAANLKVSSSTDGRIVFRIAGITNATDELTCMADILSEKSGYLPAEMNRQFTVRALSSTAGEVIAEHNMFARNGAYTSEIIYFDDLSSAGDSVDLEFDFEGCGYVRLRNTKIYSNPPAFYRKFDGGLVAGNPSSHSQTMEIGTWLNGCIKLYAQTNDPGKTDYDSITNDGSEITGTSLTLEGRDGLFLRKP